MARPNRIWFRKDIGWWMVTLGGTKTRPVRRRENRRLAEQKFHELAALQARVLDERVGGDNMDRLLTLLRRQIAEGEPNQLQDGGGIFPPAVSYVRQAGTTRRVARLELAGDRSPFRCPKLACGKGNGTIGV